MMANYYMQNLNYISSKLIFIFSNQDYLVQEVKLDQRLEQDFRKSSEQEK